MTRYETRCRFGGAPSGDVTLRRVAAREQVVGGQIHKRQWDNLSPWLGLDGCRRIGNAAGDRPCAGAFSATPPISAVVYGVAILGAAFLLSWAAEAVQIDVSQGLALALLALIAILPEYVVDASFAWLAAEDPAYAGYAIANMTGANRLLIGIAWPLVVVLAFLRFRRRFVDLDEEHGLELVVLLAATLYAFVLPFKGTLSLFDMAVLIAMFVFYLWRIASYRPSSRTWRACPGPSGNPPIRTEADHHGGPGRGKRRSRFRWWPSHSPRLWWRRA